MTTQVRKRRRTEPAVSARKPEQRRFTVAEYYRMAEAGILRPDEHVELLEGVICTMCPIGTWHAATVLRIVRWFSFRLVDRALVISQNPIHLPSQSEPEPDITIVRYRSDLYGTAHPVPEDVLLLIEVADTSLGYDRDTKLPIYAAAGIPEVWIADLNGDCLLVHRKPLDGRYTEITTVTRGGSVSSLAFPELTLPIDEIFG